MNSTNDHRAKTALLVLLVLMAELAWLRPGREVERWFIPGELGHEPGRMDGRGARAGQAAPHGFVTRAVSGGASAAGHAWEVRNAGTERVFFSHNLAAVFPRSLYDQHPEFFPFVAGRRPEPQMNPVNWNPDLARPDVAAHAAEVARDYFAAHPEASSFSLGVNDALIFGESPELIALTRKAGGQMAEAGRRGTEGEGQKAEAVHNVSPPSSVIGPPTLPNRWFRDRPDYSDLVFTFMNRAAEDLSHTHPDKYLGALAYYWAENVPDFPVQPQVLPFLTSDRSQGYDPAARAEEFALQEKWATAMKVGRPEEQKAGRTENQIPDAALPISGPLTFRLSGPQQLRPRLGMYDYLYGQGFLIPRIHTQLIAENIRHAWQAGFTDYYAEGEPNWGLDGPMHWLVAQLLQDPAQPEGRLLDEYYRRYFQAAAAPMRKFFERCEEQWMRQSGPAYWLKHYRNESQATLFPSAVCRELRGYLEEARRLARASDQASWLGRGRLTARVALVGDAFGVTERFVAMQEAKDALDRRALAAEIGMSEAAERRTVLADTEIGEIAQALESFITARERFLDYLRELKARQPMAFAPFDVRDYTSHDPVMNTLVVLGGLARKAETAGGNLPVSSGFHPSAALVAKLPRGWEHVVGDDAENWFELCRNGALEGPLIPGRRIAGLEYGVDLPVSWLGIAQPAERQRAFFVENGQAAAARRPSRALRVSGAIDTAILQWNPAVAEAFYLAQVTLRGSVSPSCSVTLTFGWLDAQQHNIGSTLMRLPEGEWPQPVVLSQGATPPPGAVYVGIGVTLEHQMGGDWVEISDFRLKATLLE